MTESIFDDEVTFISGVDQNGVLAPITFETWLRDTIPAEYDLYSVAAKWGDPVIGTSATVTYSFDIASNWTETEQNAFVTAMALWSAVAAITFSEVADGTADFQILRGTAGAYWTFNSEFSEPVGSDVLNTPVSGRPYLSINTNEPGFGPISTDLQIGGGDPFSTVVHELGHGLGLGHAGPYNGNVDAAVQQFSRYDVNVWSLMSYISYKDTSAAYYDDYTVTGTDWGYTPDGSNRDLQTPMIVDIAAAQRLYGVAEDGPLSSGGQVFGFNSNIEGPLSAIFDFTVNQFPVLTIWDGGTGNTLDLSGFSEDAFISLQPGTFSSVAGLVNNIAITPDTVIETAIGGSGDDTILGSERDNYLAGGAGRDQIYGFTGSNRISGGPDGDLIVFGTGDDPAGSGGSVQADTLADLNGDSIAGLGFSNTIEILGAALARSSISVDWTADGATLQAQASIFSLSGDFSGGNFMAVARDAGTAPHTTLSFVNDLPGLAEGVSVAAVDINGIANAGYMTGDGEVAFSVRIESAVSAYSNMLGYYSLSADGSISDVHMLFDNTLAAASSGETLSLSTPTAGDQIGFFLVQDGYSLYGDLPDDLSFVETGSSDSWTLYSQSRGALSDATVFHSFSDFNPGGAVQVLSGTGSGGSTLEIGFEDLLRDTGDNDYQDVVIAVLENDGLFIA